MSDALVPPGWVTTELGSIVRPSKEKREPHEFRGMRYIGLEHIEGGTNRIIGDLDSASVKGTAVSFAKGNILYSKLRPYLNKVALAPFDGLGSTEIMVFEPPANVDSKYLMWFLSRSETVQIATERSAGVQLPRITFDKIADLDVPLPPIADQRQIVAMIDELLGEVNRGKAKVDRVDALLRRYRQSIIDSACTGTSGAEESAYKVTSGWRMAQVDDLIVRGGIFDGARDHGSQTAVAQNLRTADYTSSGVRVIRLENLGHIRFIEDKQTFISEQKYQGLKQSTILYGDILFGSFIEESVRVCAMPRLDIAAIAKADCFCIRVRPDVVLRDYLVLQLATRRTHDVLAEDVHGATRPRITTKHLRMLEVPLCSLSEQAAIIKRVHHQLALVDGIERHVRAVSSRMTKLPQAILAKAFSGELVTVR